MNLRSIDLNLLVILDALLDEAHVSRAAQRLNLSQPAVSSALQRCRHLFGDELLDRGKGGMQRTLRGDALRAPLKSVLAGVLDLLAPGDIPLRDVERTVRITTADHPAAMMTGPLLEALRQSAPGVTAIIQPWHGSDAAIAALMNGDADLAISVFMSEPEDIMRVTLLQETYVVAMRKGHPAEGQLDLDTWLAWPHVTVSGRGDQRTPVDAQLAAMGRSRRVGLVVPTFQLVPDLLTRTDFLALLPSHSFAWQKDGSLVSATPPIAVDGFPLHLAWHRRQNGDQVLSHVTSTIRQIFCGIAAG
ncbi:LysR family transcriptional regulator [Pannonibacter phragmitetus]|uniref:LysR family transcriptional regulator n=1 Tax=Pannonibacter phragmitetus TaxID=121719 RepID=UPI000B96F67C|nr:LysR substrate-binding domain-containing protein [Pannonibacter phragmitetus]